jgi:hypothetical protein
MEIIEIIGSFLGYVLASLRLYEYFTEKAVLNYELHAESVSENDVLIYARIVNKSIGRNVSVSGARADVKIYVKGQQGCRKSRLMIKGLPWLWPDMRKKGKNECAGSATIGVDNAVLIARVRKSNDAFKVYPYFDCRQRSVLPQTRIISPHKIPYHVLYNFFDENSFIDLDGRNTLCVVFKILVYGKNASRQLRFSIYLTKDSLNQLFSKLSNAGGETMAHDLLTRRPECTC